jgi:prepilin-type N-terminal cleavage/methylation domain-containing protein
MKTPENSTIGISHTRNAFTLIELLVVITILALLLTMTVMAVNFNRDSERVVSATLQIQSFLAGARDRAIYAKEARGVRFFLDTTNYRAVTAMAYIDPAEYWSDGVIQLRRWDTDDNGLTETGGTDVDSDGVEEMDIDGDGSIEFDEEPAQVRVVAGADPGWWELKRRGLLFDGLRIRIPKGPSGTWYGVNTRMIDTAVAKTDVQKLILDVAYADPGDTQTTQAVAFSSGGPVDYELELPPRILPMDPVKLPVDTIIDLDASKVPLIWRPGTALAAGGSGNLRYSQFMDVIFSARGNVIGGAAAEGVIHLYVCDAQDSITLKEAYVASRNPVPAVTGTMTFTENGIELDISRVMRFNAEIRGERFIPTNEIRTQNAPWLTGHDTSAGEVPYLCRDRRVVTLFTQTGGVSTHPINVASDVLPDFDGIEADPFLFAETGRTGR